MRLLHISDIHFKTPDCLMPDMDPEKPYRTALLNDVKKIVSSDGNGIDAILITGDIAFKGDPEEFQFASTWINELATITNCHPDYIFTVPGNHDVDRNICKKELVKAVQNKISQASSSRDREEQLRNNILDESSGEVLLSPLSAYNEFAKSYNCQIHRQKLSWKQYLVLDQQTELCIHGLTSTLLSGHGDLDSTPGRLYLSPFQTAMEVNDRCINLVMSHHPPEWFLDHSDINQKLNSRSTIQLFGHEHEQRVQGDNTYVRFSAAAVNPERHSSGWQPGYNIIDLKINKSDGKRILHVRANLRAWQNNPEKFVSIENSSGNSFFEYAIELPQLSGVEPSAIQQQSPYDIVPSPTQSETTQENHVNFEQKMMGPPNTNKLLHRFLRMKSSERKTITSMLGIVLDEEWQLPEEERYKLAFIRANERNLLDKLSEEIGNVERD